ncbi:MAG: periplasmic heavy metal sensor [Planctomycetes bacterium]|nr:periplasmic heavy metal sensor [Planctomycetota bacterium]
MNKPLKLQIMILSVAFNLAFVAMWVAYGQPQAEKTPTLQGQPECIMPVTEESGMVCCPLHNQLNIDEQQWVAIEPPLENFRKCTQMVCGDINKLRMEVIDLLAEPEVDLVTLQSKQEAILEGQRAMQQLIIEQLLEEKKVLNPQQQKQLFIMLRQTANQKR